ncbi:hypothetical protein CDL15_Pgr012244 [Punica granatum]|uniref:Uncharacterized protein n=1 Tax=Punica granatum TaxID=22663 RepID=A0A218XM62_PUNGR|nr:hypothetical protein CDL15_Pgr012244 [Punica granatum]
MSPVSQLRWIIGPLCIIIFAAMTLYSSFLLAKCYRHPVPSTDLSGTGLSYKQLSNILVRVQQKSNPKENIIPGKCQRGVLGNSRMYWPPSSEDVIEQS